MKTLDARLVIGGLWEGAPVRATKHTGKVVDGVAVKRFPSGGGGWRVSPTGAAHRVIVAADSSAAWKLSLRLPGPLGLGLEGLSRQITARLGKKPVTPKGWFIEAYGQQCIDDTREVWLSRYLAMTDALAAELGWPTGPGAPVYTWTAYHGRWSLTVEDGREVHAYFESIGPLDYTKPMEALEATWKQECTP